MNKLSNKELQQLWLEGKDVPIDEDECINIDWYIWKRGTDRLEIWHWFDKKYKGGLKSLLYPV